MTTTDTSTRRRVKLYALNAERVWDDRGTGHVTSNYVDRLKGKYHSSVAAIKHIPIYYLIKKCIYSNLSRNVTTGSC